MLDLGIDLDVWPWIWIGLAVVLALVELAFVGGTFVLLPFAASAFIAALLAFYDVAVEIQWAVFLGGGGLLFAMMVRWVRGFLQTHELPAGVGADRLVGTTGVVIVDIEPSDSGRRGRITVDGEIWGALSRDDAPISTGSRVRITSVVGTRVVVERVAESSPDTRPNREDAP